MYNLIFGLIMAGVVTFGAVRGWTSFKEWVAEPYVAEQRAADQQVVNAAEARAKRAEEDAARAKQAAEDQSVQIDVLAKQGEEARAETKAIADAYANVVKSSEARIAALKKLAEGDPQSGRSCPEILSEVDRILRESAKVRQAR